MDLRVDADGSAALHAFSLGDPYVIDPHALSFTGRPYERPDSPSQNIAIAVGDPKYVPPEGSVGPGQTLLEFAMPLSFGSAPGDGGLYDVELHPAPGFARTQDGTPISFGDWSRTTERWHLMMWWPTRNDADAGLARLRERFVGHDVYAYGGSSLRCGGSVASYDFTAPLRVRAIDRELDRIAMIWPGNGGGLDNTPHFLAIAPLRFVFTMPQARPKSYGAPIEGTDCPEITLADWQVDTTFSLEEPPAGLQRARDWYPPIREGMSRADVAWLIGHPTEFVTRARIDEEDTWSYDGGARSSISVSFRKDRVASFTSAGE
jgi:hypothetical protein